MKLSYREISSFCLEMSLFLHAGSSFGAALFYLSDIADDKDLKKIYSDMGKLADEGASIGSILGSAGVFPDDVCSMMKIAEKTGKSEETFRALSKYYDRLDARDKQLRSALLYPSVLLLVMSAVIVLLLVYVLPIFADVYASFGTSLGGFSGFLLNFGALLSDLFPLVCAIFIIGALVLMLFSSSEKFRTKIFGFDGKGRGKLSDKINAARFAAALSMTLSSGASIEEAVGFAGELLGENKAENVKKCLDDLKTSQATDKAFSKNKLLPSPEARLLALAIKGGNVDGAAHEIADRLDRDADEALESAVSRVEPAMVIAASVLIGAILLSVMIPLANIMAAIG